MRSPSRRGRRPSCSTALGLHTVKSFQKTREEIINRQQQEMLELSTPVVKLWEGVLALPMIGTLDSARTQVVMEIAAAEDRRDRLADRDHRHHRRADRRHAGRAAPAEDGDGACASWARSASSAASGRRSRRPSSTSASTCRASTTKANLADALALALKRTG